jgi:hypothetical protein
MYILQESPEVRPLPDPCQGQYCNDKHYDHGVVMDRRSYKAGHG